MPLARPMTRPLLLLVVIALLVTELAGAPHSTSADGRSQAGPSSSSPTGVPARHRLARSFVPGETITFDEVEEGTWLTDDYLAQGVVFTSDVFTAHDNAADTNPVLSGYPKFRGDIDGYFTAPGTTTPATVTGFELDLGYINSRNSVEVFAYDANGALVDSMKAQAVGFNHITIRNAAIASFSIRIIDDEPAGFGIDNLLVSRDARGIVPTRMASFGDSYSSGEGRIGNAGLRYDCGTNLPRDIYRQDTTMVATRLRWDPTENCDTRTLSNKKPADLAQRNAATYENRCHRHGRAYPNAIRQQLGVPGSNAIFVACSGATTDHVVDVAQYGDPGSPVNVAGGQTQLATVQGFAAGGKPDFVTIGIGGNDAKFADIVRYCMLHSCADDEEWKEGTLERIEGTMYGAAEGTFRRLRGEFPDATIAAFGYPSVIGDPATDCDAWHAAWMSVGADERAWLKDVVFAAINDSLREAATAAGVTFIDIAPATVGHEICSDQPWVNGMRWFNSDSWNVSASEAFHPNELAHDAIAAYFMSHFVSNGRLIFTNPPEQEPILPVLDAPIIHGDLAAGALQGGSPAPCVQACPLTIQGQGYQPGSVVHVTVGEGGAVAGRLSRRAVPAFDVTVDAAGTFAQTVPLPKGTSAGVHAVDVSGQTADGVPQYGTAFFQVFGKRPPSLGIARVRLDPPRKLRLRGRALRVACSTTVDTTCKVQATVRVGGKRFVARGAKRSGADGRVTVVLRIPRKKVAALEKALHGKAARKGLPVRLRASAAGLTQTGHDRARSRLVGGARHKHKHR
jgi:GDSL-like lipase/acylhydrolase family protein